MSEKAVIVDGFAHLNDAFADISQAPANNRENTFPGKSDKDPAAAALGRKGGAARAASMTPERRAEIARAAATKRWKGS